MKFEPPRRTNAPPLSPYNYAFNNPVSFIDPDGMAPLAGMQTGAVESYGGSHGYHVATLDENREIIDYVTVNNKQGVDIHADGTLEKNNLQTRGDTGNTGVSDVGLDGGKCPDGDCGDGLHRYMNIAISLEKWVEKYGNWSQEDIALETGEETFGPLALPKGMPLEWRYVVNPYDGNVMDMRHVVVVGYGMGEVKGLGAEIIQKFFGLFGKDPTNSAFDPQDRYSNNIGAAFHTYDFRKNGINMSLNFGDNFNEFLNKVYKK